VEVLSPVSVRTPKMLSDLLIDFWDSGEGASGVVRLVEDRTDTQVVSVTSAR
jgi:hypothetical protein